MEEPEPTKDPIPCEPEKRLRRWRRLILRGLLLTVLAYLTILGAIWYHAITSSLAARWLRIHVFHVIFAGYVAAMALVPIGVIASGGISLLARRSGNRRLATRAGRSFLLCLGLLIGLFLCEGVCAWRLSHDLRLSHPPILEETSDQPKPDARPLRQVPSKDSQPGTFEVVIIGESSARGVPFYPRLSLDRIITWQLERAFPGKTFHAENRAEQGITLEMAIERLVGLERRPDLLIVYAGHNEFQSRFGWGRKVPYYWIESKVAPATMAKGIRAWSWGAEFFGRNADRFEIEVAPPPRYERDPADSPSCTSAEYATVLHEYRRRLDGLLSDCDSAGIATMVILPPSNLGAFDPNRSVLSPETSLADQRDFMARFEGVRSRASANHEAAIQAYRDLIVEQPGFADAHYRLAQLLEKAGSYDEARREFTRASDLDGCPFRCQTPFLNVCRDLGERHRSIVIDAPQLLARACPHGIVGNRMFVDAHHPSLNNFVIMAREALYQLKARKMFGWPASAPVPEFTTADCVEKFHLDQDLWIKICTGSQKYYGITGLALRDRKWRYSIADQYGRGLQLLTEGKGPDETGLPALQIKNELRAEPLPGEGGMGDGAMSDLEARASINGSD